MPESLHSIANVRQYELSAAEFARLRRLVQELTGIHLMECKREMIYRRLAKRLDSLELDTFGEYCELLEGGDDDEIEKFANAMTTNLTYFFRETHHFDYLQHNLLPHLEKPADRELRIWSAGCSSGEEPYSLAILLHECLANLRGWDVKILATDLDSISLGNAKKGIYKAEQIERIPNGWAERWFEKNADGDSITIDPKLRDMVYFRHHNLMGRWPMRKRFDVIFCRNVVIYFDKDTQRRLFGRFAKLQRSNDLLFIGHSENLHNVGDSYDLIGQTIYRRV